MDTALHYWSFNEVEDKGATNKKSKTSEDDINKQEAKLQNGVEDFTHDQLGKVLKFSKLPILPIQVQFSLIQSNLIQFNLIQFITL